MQSFLSEIFDVDFQVVSWVHTQICFSGLRPVSL